MKKLSLFFPAIITIIILSSFPAFAQEQAEGDLWICPGAEAALYSFTGAAYGGSLALGYGKGASVGLKAAYFFDSKGQVDTLELGVLLRFYFLGPNSGLFIQFSGGPAFFFHREDSPELPAEFGMVCAGLSLGWRFLLGKVFFIEPSVRGGYPFIAGAGLSAGVHF